MITPSDILSAPILVVDDKEANIQLLLGMLRVAGYTSVHSTNNPRQVAALHHEHRFNLILLDLQMPEMDGFEVMEALKQQDPTGYLPVLVITAQPSHKLRALEAGAKDFVNKPFDFAELRARVRNILEVRLYSEALAKTIRELEASREAERKLTEREDALAGETQKSLLPRVIPNFGGFQICAYNKPTRHVGGDFYDFLQLPSGEWLGVLGDVSGKGMPAALLSSMVLGALNMKLRSGTQPREALAQVNDLLYEKSLDFQYVTLFLFTLSPGGTGEFISAGHIPAYIYRAATKTIHSLHSEDHFLGMFDFGAWAPRPFHLDKGDILIAISDGVTDAENNQNEMFSEKRLLSLIQSEAPKGSKSLKQALLTTLEQYTDGKPQGDDLTFLLIEP